MKKMIKKSVATTFHFIHSNIYIYIYIYIYVYIIILIIVIMEKVLGIAS